MLESLQGAVVTLRGQLIHNTSSPLLQHTNKKAKQSSAPSETIRAALYLNKVSFSTGDLYFMIIVWKCLCVLYILCVCVCVVRLDPGQSHLCPYPWGVGRLL